MAPLLDIAIDEAQLRALEQLDAHLNQDREPLLEEIAGMLEDLLRQHAEAGDFAPIAESTIEVRKRRGRDDTTPLFDTSSMVGDIRSKTTDDTASASAPWPALALALGVTLGQKSAFPGAKLPARAFVYLSEEEQEGFVDIVEEFFLGP
jgi:phage gpG-like protein